MSLQALTIPRNIAWRRLAYSADMVDTRFGDLELPPKWRSSMAVYYYLVPEESTAEEYPDARILYLRLSCSITGWAPSEDLEYETLIERIGDDLNDAQRAMWESIAAHGWMETYWPCLGAIAQVAIYPSGADEVGIDEYPHIYDFEPKKRELFETVSESGEMLSGTSNQLALSKSTTQVKSTEESTLNTAGGGASFDLPLAGGVLGLSGSYQRRWGTAEKTGHETTEVRNTNTAQEQRETTSHTTSFSQMYQLFNGYHLGTNRALFLMSPRPHVVNRSSEQLENNLVNGERKLEGIQDMFLVVHVPKTLKGFCVHAMLDTGHSVEFEELDSSPEGVPLEGRPLVITRRFARNCAELDEDGRLVIVGAPELPTDPPSWPPTYVGGELVMDSIPVLRAHAGPRSSLDLARRAQVATARNRVLEDIRRGMLASYASRRYKARTLFETTSFKLLASRILSTSSVSLGGLAGAVLDHDIVKKLDKGGVRDVGALFEGARDDVCRKAGIDPDEIRARVLDSLIDPIRTSCGRTR